MVRCQRIIRAILTNALRIRHPRPWFDSARATKKHQNHLRAYFSDYRWAARQKKRDLLDEGFVRDLHRQMFDKTWHWAGTFCQTNKNIGVDWTQIAVKLRDLLDSTRYQIENHVFNEDGVAVRFHHQLVLIHAFLNGNGRHSRLMADLLITRLGQPRLTWGGASASLTPVGAIRDRYLIALRAADQEQIDGLIEFARS